MLAVATALATVNISHYEFIGRGVGNDSASSQARLPLFREGVRAVAAALRAARCLLGTCCSIKF